ncbi:MAG: menaquinol-cytochrome c reductase cytochrome b subunit, partial [Acidimicrobiales bacterium]|nr:menaquinol-cytochrome c reductase cytochrome b subunit [Acidimicrobiales bacterium]
MTEIPEHLLKRAAAARDKAKVEPAPAAEEAAGDSRIPAHLLQRSKAAKTSKDAPAAEPAGAVAVADKVG